MALYLLRSYCTQLTWNWNSCHQRMCQRSFLIKLHTVDLGMLDGATTTQIYNDNASCIEWATSCTTKGIKHLNLHENQVRETHQSGECHISHISGQINPSDIFTKEINDAAHFRRLCNCILVSKAVFLKYHHNVPLHIISADRILPYYSRWSLVCLPRDLNQAMSYLWSPSLSFSFGTITYYLHRYLVFYMH